MMQQYQGNSYLFGGNAPYVEEMYEAYLDNPGSVPDNWRTYFDALQHVPAVDGSEARDVAHAPVVESFAQRAKANAFAAKASSADLAVARKQVHVQSLIAAYRFLGNRWAELDPLKRAERPKIPELDPAFYDLTESDMDISFSAVNSYFGGETMTLRQIVQALRETYCGSIGSEFMHGSDPGEKRWWQERLEKARGKADLHARREEAHPRPLDRGRRPGALPPHQVRRPEALLAGRRRELHRGDGRTDPARRRARRAGDRHRHGPPGSPERAGQHAGQDARRPVRRVRAQGRRRPAGRRREVPPGLQLRRVHAGRSGPPEPGVQPVPPGNRQPGRGRQRARPPGPPWRHRRQPGAAGAGARRRGLRWPGRRAGNAGHGADARLPHGWHGAHRHQQPDRLHYQRPARPCAPPGTAPTSSR